MTKPLRYFIDIAGDEFSCTSTLERNEEGLYEFEWESGFQSGTSEYETVEGNVIEITKAEYDMIRMTVEDEELLDYQLAVKDFVIQKYKKEENEMNKAEKEFLQFIRETEGLQYYQASVEQLIQFQDSVEQFMNNRK